jgi:hypothetical protein
MSQSIHTVKRKSTQNRIVALLQSAALLCAAGATTALALVQNSIAQPSNPTLPAPEVKSLSVTAPKRILFVGNSYFYYGNSLHNHVNRMVQAGGMGLQERDIQYKSATIGGASLAHHNMEWLTEPGRIGVKEPFELVVMADGSAQPLNEERRATSRQIIAKHAETIRRRGGEVALYMTHVYVPPHRQVRADNLHLTARHYLSVGNEIKAMVIPVALAFDEAYRRRPNVVLHTDFDGSHPDILGTYLAACVTYASIYNKTCSGNSYNYFGRIAADDIAFLQQVGDDVVKRFFGR